MKWLDWTNMQFYQYLMMGGGAVALLALLLAFVPRMRVQIPAAVLGTLGGLTAGAALGVLGLACFGYHWEPQPQGEGTTPTGMNGPPMMPMGMAGGPGGGGRGPGGPGGGGRRMGGFGPNPKSQLASLVVKLDVLSQGRPLELRLDSKCKQKVLKELEGLADQEKLDNAVAQKKLDALLILLKDDRSTLENAGFNWPGSARGGRRPQVENPFTQGDNKEHLTALTERWKRDGK